MIQMSKKSNKLGLFCLVLLLLLIIFYLFSTFRHREKEKLNLPAFSGNYLFERDVGFIIGGWINYKGKDLMTATILKITNCGKNIENLGKIKDFKPRAYFPISKHNDIYYASGGFEFNPPSNVIGDFWVSNDLKNWKMKAVDAEWERREAHATVSHNGKLFLFGGVSYFVPEKYVKPKSKTSHLRNFNDVWILNEDKWVLLVENAPWEKRRSFGYGSLGEYIYLWGGISDETNELFNDVWRTKDGISWEKILENAAWSGRMINNYIAVFDDRIWIMGGGGSVESILPLNDLWSSKDGINWKLEIEDLPFKGRIGSSVFNFYCNNKDYLFVYGGIEIGENGKKKFTDDVWRIPLIKNKNNEKETKKINIEKISFNKE